MGHTCEVFSTVPSTRCSKTACCSYYFIIIIISLIGRDPKGLMGRENREISSPSLGQLCSKDVIPKSGWEPLLSAHFLSPHVPKPHDSFKAQLQASFSPSPGESSGQKAEDSDPGPGQSAQG